MRRRHLVGALPLLAALLVGCGAPPSAPADQLAPTASSTRTTAQPAPAPDPFDLAAALALIEGQGFTPDPPEGRLSGPIRAIHAICTGSANGRCQAVFFFDGQQLVHRVDVGLVNILSQDGRAVRVEFPVYAAGDPSCCPSGTPTQHTITVQNGRLDAQPPVGFEPNYPGDY
ncbi:LppP/LprE family lipoprotein [Saccharopolyspora shandongensis]|uniref:LppP/LprE family lipoprotein n=1 Tax=Saccharopolyspora shandongensis TaxID=418495 RepID=UPI0033CA77BB